MAEHVRNELARAGAPVRPSQVMTPSNYLDRRAGAPPAAPLALKHRLIRDALARLRPPRFEAVARYRGFHQAIADLMEEAPPEGLAGAVADDLGEILAEVDRELAARQFASRNGRLKAAAENSGALPARVVFDGFFSFSVAERRLIAAIAQRSSVTVTLPEADAELLGMGFAELRLSGTHRNARRIEFSAATMDGEVEEIARRILEEAARGRAFREMGVILRVREPYGPALETAFARFGIPARFYFADALIENPAIAYLNRIVRAMIAGWDHGAILAALRMPVSGIGATAEGDRLDFEMRERLPASGAPLPESTRFLERFDAWRRERLSGAEWAGRFRQLRSILPPPVVGERPGRIEIGMWRSAKWGLDAFDDAVVQAAANVDASARLSLGEMWEEVELALTLDPRRADDRRRNVVHVMDVYEARQWELAVVFLCGLVERHFPQYHREDPLIGDAVRRRAGLETAAGRQSRERFLFELATTRATEATVLSYSRFNEKGEEMLRSFFLPEAAPQSESRARPAPVRVVNAPPRPAIQSDALLAELGRMHGTLAPTAIESFLQCPFQFYAKRTLRLRARPAAPRDRLDVLLQGSILHRALAEAARMPLFGAAVFDDVFAEECRRVRVPEGYRKEAVRLELLRNFEAFLKDRQTAIAWPSGVEQEFEFALSPILSVRGRIDRLDEGPRGEALVIDYKYSAPEKIRDRVDDEAAENFVQGGLYLIAAENFFAMKPAGMLFCGLRRQVTWKGWHTPVAGLEQAGEIVSESRLRELMAAAAEKSADTFDAISSGRIAPQPADRKKCDWCDYRDICRFEIAGAAIGAAG